MKKLVIFCTCLLVLAYSVNLGSQTKPGDQSDRSYVTVRNADFVRSFDYNGRIINRLIGNVIIEIEDNGVVVTCDSAYMYTSDSLDLFSHVEMLHGASTIYCDKMNYDGTWARVRGHIVKMTKDDMVLLTQNFDYHIENELGLFFNGGTVDRKGEILESDRGYYYAKDENFVFAGNVALKNKDYTLECDSLHYGMKSENITFLGQTKIWRDENFISANYGWQHKAKDELHFSDKVYMYSPDKELWADSVFFYQTEEKGRLYGNIQITDTVKSVMLFGDEMYFTNVPEYAEVTKNPAIAFYGEQKEKAEPAAPPMGSEAMEQQPLDSLQVTEYPFPADSSSTRSAVDTLFLIADTLRSISHHNPLFGVDSLPDYQKQDSLFRTIIAHHNVKVYRSDLQAACDSLVLTTQDSIGRMFINPVLWSDSAQITSDSIRFTVIDGSLKYADFQSSAFIAMQEDSTHFSQVKGRDMKAFFENNAIYELDVYGNSQSIYYMREKNEISSVNKSESSDMVVNIVNNKLTRVKYINKPESKIYPLDIFPEGEDKLKGFSWQEQRRPKSRYELFSKPIHPSYRSEAMKHQQPTFKRTEHFNKLAGESWQAKKPTFEFPTSAVQ